MKRINREHIIGIICILLGAIVLVLTRTFPKGAASSMQLSGPGFFPNVLAIILLFIGFYQIFLGMKCKATENDYTVSQLVIDLKKPQATTVLILIGMLIFFVIFLKILGFFTTSFVFLYVVLWRFKTKWWKNMLISFIFLAIIYIVFVQIFTTRLPSGILI